MEVRTVVGICMTALGSLVLKANYIPNAMGIALIIAGAGYLLDGVRFFFFPAINADWILVTFLGELVFMVWLLAKGRKLQVV